MLPPLHYTTDLWCQKQCGTCTKQASRPKENNRRRICELLIWQRRQKHALGKNQLIQQMVVTKLDTNLQKTEHRSIYTTLPQIQLKPSHYLHLKLKHSNNGWFQHLSLTNGLVIQGEKKLCRETLELNNVINQMGLKDIYRTLHPSTKGYTFFSASHGAFFKIGDIRTQHLNKYEKNEITLYFILPPKIKAGIRKGIWEVLRIWWWWKEHTESPGSQEGNP